MRGEGVEMGIKVMSWEEVVGIEELPSCGDDEGGCEDVNWVKTTGSSNAVVKMGKVEKGIAIEICKGTIDVQLQGVRILEI